MAKTALQVIKDMIKETEKRRDEYVREGGKALKNYFTDRLITLEIVHTRLILEDIE